MPPSSETGAHRALSSQDESSTIRELELTILALRDQLIGSEAKLGELRADLQREQARYARAQELFEIRTAHASNERAIREDLKKQLDDMRASTTWRVGRAVLKPVQILRSTRRPS